MTKNNLTIKPLAAALALLGMTLATPAAAFKFQMENGLEGSFDSTISFGMQRRMKSPDSSIIGNDSGGNVPTTGDPRLGAGANPDFNYTNVDDGDLNYKKGDIVSAVLKGTHEMFLKDPGNWSALGRFTWSSDMAATHTQRTPLDSEAHDALSKNVTLLDLWVAKEFSIGEQSAKVKLGNQVISWGEDIFIIGGVNSINALDLRKIHTPGTQLKEIFIPAPMISFTSGLGHGFSTEAYYQFAWNKFILDPAGSYWSSADFIGKGGKRGAFFPSSITQAFFGLPGGDFDPTRGRTLASLSIAGGGAGVIPVEQASPSNGGQYGVNLRFKPESGDTEYAGYFIRYHDKLPFVGFRYDPTTANLLNISAVEQYGQDRSLYGLSMNTKAGDWAIGAEVSYRPRDSVAIDPTVPAAGQYAFFDPANGFGGAGTYTMNGYKDERKWQGHVTAFRLLPPNIYAPLGAAEGYVMGEVAVTHYPGLDLSGNVPYLLNNYTLPTKTSWGYVLEAGLTYADIFNSGWTMSPIIDWYHDVRGVSPNTIPFVEGRRAVNVGLNFDYHNQWKAALGYTTFFGGGNLNMMRDRDVVFASVSYTF